MTIKPKTSSSLGAEVGRILLVRMRGDEERLSGRCGALDVDFLRIGMAGRYRVEKQGSE